MRALRKKKNRNYIEKIKDAKGNLMHSNKDIIKAFIEYYRKLYNISPLEGSETIDSEKNQKRKKYLETAGLLKLSEDQLNSLDADISQDEIKLALKGTVSGKSPGPDGYTVRYYKKFSEILVPKLKKLHECTRWRDGSKKRIITSPTRAHPKKREKIPLSVRAT
ncbi:unnamed protein product, partial [Staurois parvus]